MATNVVYEQHNVADAERAFLIWQQPMVIWFTGLSASGKSTIAGELDRLLLEHGKPSCILDGNNLRCGLNRDLGFSREDRKENVRRIREVAKLMKQAGLFVLVAAISPYREDRDEVRASLPKNEFIEIYVKATLATCEARDPKDLYEKARSGLIADFTGINSPYEEPLSPELVFDTDEYETPRELAQRVFTVLDQWRRLAPPAEEAWEPSPPPPLEQSSSSSSSSSSSPPGVSYDYEAQRLAQDKADKAADELDDEIAGYIRRAEELKHELEEAEAKRQEAAVIEHLKAAKRPPLPFMSTFTGGACVGALAGAVLAAIALPALKLRFMGLR